MSEAFPRLVHATAIALDATAVLIRGPSGSGKSDLALRCLAWPANPLIHGTVRLVADDQVRLDLADGGVQATSPPAIAGRLEVRGVGIVAVPTIAMARVRLVVDLVAADAVERLPEPDFCDIGGISLPLLRLTPFETSAPVKLLLCLGSAGA